ncbi:hypothetical protein Agub_g874, partial [Astrephomene gubernaculifera]
SAASFLRAFRGASSFTTGRRTMLGGSSLAGSGKSLLLERERGRDGDECSRSSRRHVAAVATMQGFDVKRPAGDRTSMTAVAAVDALASGREGAAVAGAVAAAAAAATAAAAGATGAVPYGAAEGMDSGDEEAVAAGMAANAAAAATDGTAAVSARMGDGLVDGSCGAGAGGGGGGGGGGGEGGGGEEERAAARGDGGGDTVAGVPSLSMLTAARLSSRAVIMRSWTRQRNRLRRRTPSGFTSGGDGGGGGAEGRFARKHKGSATAAAAAAATTSTSAGMVMGHMAAAATAATAAASRSATDSEHPQQAAHGHTEDSSSCGAGRGVGTVAGAFHDLVVIDMGVHRLNIPAIGAAYGDVYDGVQVIQILPSHLKHRAAYHAPLRSPAMLAPGFFEAPGASQALLPRSPGQPPSFPRLSLMFVQPAGYTAVANSHPEVAERSGAVFCATVRDVLRMYGAYECQEYECTFMVACHDPRVGAEAALALHTWLLHADWPADLLELSEGREVLGSDGQPVTR